MPEFLKRAFEELGLIPGIIIFVVFSEILRRMLFHKPKIKEKEPPEGYGCPKCRCEYEKHIQICPDCNVPLVENVKEYLDK